jgi:outer membrane protein assembly factor BamB
MKKRIIFIPLLLILIASLAGCVHPADLVELIRAPFDSPSTRLSREGMRLEAEGRTTEAILAYRGALEFDASNFTALTRLGQLFAEQGRRRSALRLFERAFALQPGDSSIRMRLEQPPPADRKELPIQLTWQVYLGDSTPVGIAVSGDRLYASLENGVVAALETSSGRLGWKIKLPTRASSAPTVHESWLWVGGEDGRLFALSTVDGSTRWTFPTQGAIYAAPTPGDNVLFCTSSDKTLSALERDSGKPIWQARSSGALHSSPTLANGVVFFGSLDARLYALKAENGQPLWQIGFLTQGAVESQPVVVGNRVIFGSGDGRIYALAADSGGEFWRYSTSDAAFASALVDNERVFAASSGGSLTALDLISGEPAWNLRTEGSIATTPALVDGVLYYYSPADAYLYAVQALNGKTLGKFDTGDWLVGDIQASGNSLFLAGKDGTLLAFNIQE